MIMMPAMDLDYMVPLGYLPVLFGWPGVNALGGRIKGNTLTPFLATCQTA
jgi:hypothetical protein